MNTNWICLDQVTEGTFCFFFLFFSSPVGEGDLHKRLLFTMWNSTSASRCQNDSDSAFIFRFAVVSASFEAGGGDPPLHSGGRMGMYGAQGWNEMRRFWDSF